MHHQGGKNGGDGDVSRVQCSHGDIELSPRAQEKIDNGFIRSLIVKIINKRLLGISPRDPNDVACDHGQMTSGAILVFLPGSGEIESLARCLFERGTITGDRDLCKIMKLHSTIPKSDQRRVFQPVSIRMVKIVLATNIAEVRTSCFALPFLLFASFYIM